MRTLFLLLLFVALSVSGRTIMEVSTNEVVFYEVYQPVPGVITFVDSTNDNVEFTATSIIVDNGSVIIGGASSVAVTAPPLGYIQWLYGGTESAFPTSDKMYPLSLSPPTVDGTNSIFQIDVGILRYVEVIGSGNASFDGTYIIGRKENGKQAWYKTLLRRIRWESSQWEMVASPLEDFVHYYIVNSGSFPPKTSWLIDPAFSDYDAPAPTISYDSLWVSSEEFKTNTYSDIVSNPQGTNGVYVKYNSSSNITEIITYPTVLSASKHALAMNYLNATYLPDVDTVLPSVDLSGFAEFAPPVSSGIGAKADTPEIAEWTRQNAPGDTMALTGENL